MVVSLAIPSTGSPGRGNPAGRTNISRPPYRGPGPPPPPFRPSASPCSDAINALRPCSTRIPGQVALVVGAPASRCGPGYEYFIEVTAKMKEIIFFFGKLLDQNYNS